MTPEQRERLREVVKEATWFHAADIPKIIDRILEEPEKGSGECCTTCHSGHGCVGKDLDGTACHCHTPKTEKVVGLSTKEEVDFMVSLINRDASEVEDGHAECLRRQFDICEHKRAA